MDAVDKLWKETSSSRPNLKKLCAAAASSGAPQFYITPKQALEKYCEWKRTHTFSASSSETRQMYLCIFSKYEEAYKASKGMEFKYYLMQDVLDSPAPSFYISPSAAVAFYYRAMAYKRTLARK